MEHTTAHYRELLKDVFDPELGVNIVDLGLVYDIRDEEEQVYVQMTLTTPGCPMHDTITSAVRWTLGQHTDKHIEVDVVWEPRWTPQMMSEDAKFELGF